MEKHRFVFLLVSPTPTPPLARFPSGLTEGAELKLILEMETMLTTRVMEAVTEVGESPL